MNIQDHNGRGVVLDAFCGAGGAAMGYHRAGWQVVGIDVKPQPHYPFPFIQGDAIKVLDLLARGVAILTDTHADVRVSRRSIAFTHLSPPCQLFCMYRNNPKVKASTDERYVNLIPDAREGAVSLGLPYVIENVPGARSELRDPVQLCGTTFDTRVRRHRLFELGGWKLLYDNIEDEMPAPGCAHGKYTDRIFPGSSNRPNGRTVCNVGEWRVPLDVQKVHMKIDWEVTTEEVSEMVPPVMTEFLGRKMYRWLDR
jgi:DNA (cytosine-5)-methyltransferase 1